MRKIYFTLIVFVFAVNFSFAQWSTSGANIYNSNTGYVGIGTTSPLTMFDVRLAANQHVQFVQNVNSAYSGASGIVCINDGNTAYTPLGFLASNYEFGVGNVGIGTNTASTALQIGNFSNGSSNNQLLIPGAYNFEQVRLGQIGNGNSALEFVNHTSVSPSYGIKFLVDVDSGFPGLQLQYAPSASAYSALSYTTGLYMDLSGNIAIGTTHNDGYKLAVNGAAIATSVTVKTYASWPDYVFKKNYQLPSLATVKTYIDKNHHLPEMPSEQQVAKDGLNLGEVNTLLVKKVEELTLYLIEKDKQIKEMYQKQQTELKIQSAINKKLQERLNELQNQIKNCKTPN